MAINRETLIVQSTQDYVREQLFDVKSYPEDQIVLLDSFPHNRFDGPLDKNYIAFGFNFDDEGRQAELGSDLKTRTYTLEFFTFGLNSIWGSNLANAIKFAADTDGVIPLLDYGQIAKPEIDRLIVTGTRAEQQVIPEPAPYEENVWVTWVNVEDCYFARLV